VSTDVWGIHDRYFDALGIEHVTSRETRAAILTAMGLDPAALLRAGARAGDGERAGGGAHDDAVANSATADAHMPALARTGDAPPVDHQGESEVQNVRVVRAGTTTPLAAPGELMLEDGTTLPVAEALPADLPIGYHRLLARDGRESLVIVTPGRCHLPDDLRTWGWAAQLYAARSRESWGIGDLADLRRLGRWARQVTGAGVVMINPITAATPVRPIEPSPYYPSSRRFRNPLFLRIEEVPGMEALGADLVPLAQAGRALNQNRRIDREAIFMLKMDALERIFDHFTGDERFDRYWRQQGEALTQFAAYCALSERHGKDWRRWPSEYRRPESGEVARFVTEEARRVRFHAWLQWLVDEQLATAAREIAIINDLPIGLDVAGADAWCWQDLLARDVSVGAPPDEFAVTGQDWGLTPFIPHRLRATGYEPFRQTIRAMLRHAGGLRIDHVMGLFRLFWIPRALGAAQGTYVRSRADELLAIVAVESQRAQAFIVGEDLGNVEAGVREELAAQRMLSYRLMYFEPAHPREFPELALSGVTTHDLATIAGLWTGGDVASAREAGIETNEPGMRSLRDKIAREAEIPADARPEAAIEKTYAALARAPSRVILATLDDAVAVLERPNMPGTVSQWPNWSLALPLPLEEIEQHELPQRLAKVMKR
jgi:4-alpha-glucanotransferase